METRSDRIDRFARLLTQSRIDADKSQQHLAKELGVSRTTIVNWESGQSFPDLFKTLEWFRVLGLNPHTYLSQYLYPNEIEDISANDSDERINEALKTIISHFTTHEKRELLYCLYGSYNSDISSILELFTAYCHLPLRHRVSVANNISEIYEMCDEHNELIEQDHIMPDFDRLKTAISLGKQAAKNNQTGYNI